MARLLSKGLKGMFLSTATCQSVVTLSCYQRKRAARSTIRQERAVCTSGYAFLSILAYKLTKGILMQPRRVRLLWVKKKAYRLRCSGVHLGCAPARKDCRGCVDLAFVRAGGPDAT